MTFPESRTAGSGTNAEGGIALVAVLWVTASLALIVLALSMTVRVDVRATATQRDLALASALGDGAVNIAAAVLSSSPPKSAGQFELGVLIDDYEVEVSALPASAFINLNLADESILRGMMIHIAGLTEDAASVASARIEDWRDPDDVVRPNGAERDDYIASGASIRPRNAPFESVEDLLQVLGLGFDLYAIVRPFVTVHDGGSRGIDPLFAPAEVVAVLAEGDQALVRTYLRARVVDGVLADTSSFDPTYLATPGGQDSVYRVSARVRLQDRIYVRARWLSLGESGQNGEPWMNLQTEPVVVE